ncbi:hypothetical protein ACMWGK_21825, partial [Klebsiella pneumoniae]
MKKLLAILPLLLAGCAQPQPTAPTKTIGMPNPAAVYCQQLFGTLCATSRQQQPYNLEGEQVMGLFAKL